MKEMKMAIEERNKKEVMTEPACICQSYPSYKANSKEDDFNAYYFPTQEKNKKLAEQVVYNDNCLIYSKMKRGRVARASRIKER